MKRDEKVYWEKGRGGRVCRVRRKEEKRKVKEKIFVAEENYNMEENIAETGSFE